MRWCLHSSVAACDDEDFAFEAGEVVGVERHCISKVEVDV